MQLYSYLAKNLSGKSFRGKTEAEDERALAAKLQGDSLFLISARTVEKAHERATLGAMELSDFSRQVGTMLSSGVSLLRAVNIISKRDLSPKVKGVYKQLYSDLQRGMALSAAMAKQDGAFPELLISMFIAGESSGKLDITAMKMADHYEKEHRLHTKIKGAMTYPIVLLCVTIVVVIAIFTFVLPNFFAIFEGMELPAITQFVMAVSNAMVNHWLIILIGILVLIAAVGLILKQPRVRYAIDRAKLRIPAIGKLLKIIYTARFARTLSSLYSSGLTMLSALQISRETIGNRYISKQFDGVLNRVRQGENLSSVISTVDGFDIKLASTIQIGEETGKLDDMLESVANSFDYESEAATTQLTAILEPVLIIFMAVIIGFIMISVMLPLFDVYNNIG